METDAISKAFEKAWKKAGWHINQRCPIDGNVARERAEMMFRAGFDYGVTDQSKQHGPAWAKDGLVSRQDSLGACVCNQCGELIQFSIPAKWEYLPYCPYCGYDGK